MSNLLPDEQSRRLKSKNRALFVVLLGLAALLFAVTYVRMSEVEERRHETMAEPHRPSLPPGTGSGQ
ncbi:hypothetical protein JL101_027425 [Skermanella rosea]|uniref:Uncharacterized protein n=1 Tax=Skermanella cutis TaxID=2775420 RepID=A0ABX7B5V2_9PROT|nr:MULTISPECIES: hypothetical protein [Skermanella]QQP89494.1 hypothetical protein IGS68_26575 [Skermanella sp. TT6]UEM03639.1 hypothetical protein JL101_027425 [Skermanella rosea]